ncbi:MULTISPECIES: DNA cytosine methyltransferase [Campylobacter]|uniref:Cytosine-specific methyltransferase n=1 Tax=Campylobacter vicugnae TaxID=1660076 RepID=A0A1X9T308_9BACT|nr:MULTISPECIES: DNA (cytosine-5-)-methyltransferase [unclassified Campylobacter]ARR02779.1 cytosine-specific DNA methyltransferase [Campylobacter sp. RM8964]MBQ8820710.1 DNA (cytosine-5-)-methyltransferase [Campylobacter sp.]
MQRVKPQNIKFDTISLFAGIGGLDLGFKYAGFNLIWANDFDKFACLTYKENVGKEIICGDIREVQNQIPKHEILLAGFPCQPFSTLGKLEGFEDRERGTLFFEIQKIIENYDTKVVVLENVKNIINHDKGKTFDKILSELDKLGFYTYYEVLNSADFGVPQRRNRCFIMAFSKKYFKETKFEFPKKQKLEITTQDLLDKRVEAKYFLSKKIINTILGYGTKGYIAKPTIDLPISKTLTATMAKMHRASQDNYVTDEKNFALNSDDTRTNVRKLTPNECRKLQGFPDDWKQVVSDCQAYKQFGNAVTVNVSYAIAKEIFKFIELNRLF